MFESLKPYRSSSGVNFSSRPFCPPGSVISSPKAGLFRRLEVHPGLPPRRLRAQRGGDDGGWLRFGVGGFLGVGVDRMERGEGERAPPGATGQCALFLVRQTRCFEGQRVIESNIPIGDVMPLCNKPGRRQQSGQQGQTFSQGDNSTRSDEAGKTTLNV